MTTTPISQMEGAAQRGATHLLVVSYADLTDTAAATKTLELDIPASTTRYIGVSLVGYILKTAFTSSDTDANSLTVTVGDDGGAERFLAAASTQLLGAATEKWAAGGIASTPEQYEYVTTDTLEFTFLVAVGAGTPLLSELTAGEVHFYLRITDSYSAKAV